MKEQLENVSNKELGKSLKHAVRSLFEAVGEDDFNNTKIEDIYITAIADIVYVNLNGDRLFQIQVSIVNEDNPEAWLPNDGTVVTYQAEIQK